MFDYRQISSIPEEVLKRRIDSFIEEDIPEIDYTTVGTIPGDKKIKAILESGKGFVFAGRCIIEAFFPSEEFRVNMLCRDGDYIEDKTVFAEITGNARTILQLERTLLNILQRLCGIASTTRKYVEAAGGKIDILDTRKTLPGFRLLDKYAVFCGGGRNHRLNLSEGVMIKDNHITAAGSIENAVNSIRKSAPGIPIEVEIDRIEQIEQLETFEDIDAFLLDNMSPEEIRKATALIKSRPEPSGGAVFIEASGGLTLENIPEYSDTGVDAVSVGALTHSVIAADIHMEFENISPGQ